MAIPAEEEELRETYYIRCRNEGYTIDEASKRSLAYIMRILNADKSLATTGYLEQLYQVSKSRSKYASTQSSYDDDLLRSTGSLGDSRDRSTHGVLGDFSDMRDSLPSFFADLRKQHEKDWSGPGRRAPEYIPFPYDYQNNAPGPRGESYGYAHSHGRFDPPCQSTYGPRTHSFDEFCYTLEDRQPRSAYGSYASDSTCPSYLPLSDDFRYYTFPHSHTASSSHSFRPGARPSDSYIRPPPPRHTFYSTFNSGTDFSRDGKPSSYYHARPSSSCPPIPPQPEGIKPTIDLYTVLGVTRNAETAEIKKAHRALSLIWHPDRCTEPDKKEATKRMAEINQANDVLCDEVKRRFYDLWGVLPSEY